MGRSKDAIRRHERDMEELERMTLEIMRHARDSSLSLSEVIGNLESAKWLMLQDAYETVNDRIGQALDDFIGMDVLGELDELLSTDGEEG